MNNYRQQLIQLKTTHELLIKQKTDASAMLVTLAASIATLAQARDVVNAVQMATQISISGFIEEVVSLCLQTVLGANYGFKINYKIQRGKSEAELLILKDGEAFDAETSCGGGVVDIVAFALRVALYALADPKPEGVIFLDEPARMVSKDGEHARRFGEMLKKVSELLNLQFIVISHEPLLIEMAGRSFRVLQRDGISSVAVLP